MVGFSVTSLLRLCISGWLWEEFAPARPVPRGVCTPGGDGFASVFGAFGLRAARVWCRWLEERGAPCEGWEPAAISNTAPRLHGNQQQEHPAVQLERKKRMRRRVDGCHLPWGLWQGSAGLCSPTSSDLPGDGGVLWALSTCAHWYRGTHNSFWLIPPNPGPSPSTTSHGLVPYNR